MKKRLVLLAVALCLALTVFGACENYASALQDITQLLRVDYSEVSLNVTTVTNGVTMTGIYTLTFDGDATIVEYSYDRFNELNTDGNNAGEYFSKVTGVATVVDGKVVEGDSSVTLPQEIDFGGLSFKPAFFARGAVNGTSFGADVVNPRGFTGNIDMVCTDMRVTVIYTPTALSKITITYTSDAGSNVSITYLFTK